MIYLLLSIGSSTGIFLIFRLFRLWGADTLKAIVINYGVAAAIGWTLAGGWDTLEAAWGSPWTKAAGLAGLLFIYLFHLIAKSTQILGITVTSIAAKLSMVIPVAVFLFFDPADEPEIMKLAAIAMAIPAVVLSSWNQDAQKPPSSIQMPLIIFFGGGLIDLMFGWYSGPQHMSRIEFRYVFATIPFTIAFVIGLIWLTVRYLTTQKPAPSHALLQRNTWVGGIALGMVNFTSLYFLLETYDKLSLDRSAIMPITNLGIVLFSSLMAALLFKEKLTRFNRWGLLLGVLSIGLLMTQGLMA